MLSSSDTYALDLSFLYIIKTTPLAIAYLFHRTVCHSLVCVSLFSDEHSTETPIHISMAINAIRSYCSFPAVHFRLVLSHYLTPSPIPGISVSSFLTAAFGITTYSISNMPRQPTIANGSHSQERSYEDSWSYFLHWQENARPLIFHFPYANSSNDQSLNPSPVILAYPLH